ncbi:MAG: SPW repeat protein [Nitrospirae bacterium]|nr:SPW repeat protein [Candidatus Manganitrophaceae bacterium]
MKVFVYLNLIVGIWLVVSPFLFRYTYNTAEFWNSEVVGIMLLVITSVVGFSVPRRKIDEPLSQVERRRRT